ncbi:MBL fold metallo-hydrolase [Patescibacteria group bacterium]
MPVEMLKVGQLGTNCYLFYSNKTKEALIIDPGDDAGFIISKIKDLELKPKAIIATHGHFDHVLAATELKLAFNIPFYISQKDEGLLKNANKTAKFFLKVDFDPVLTADKYLNKKSQLKLGNLRLKIMSTPGHTKGSVSLYSKTENLIFVGDLIFAHGGYGRTDLKGGDFKTLTSSVKEALSLPRNTTIYPGHGEATSIKQEKKNLANLLK